MFNEHLTVLPTETGSHTSEVICLPDVPSWGYTHEIQTPSGKVEVKFATEAKAGRKTGGGDFAWLRVLHDSEQTFTLVQSTVIDHFSNFPDDKYWELMLFQHASAFKHAQVQLGLPDNFMNMDPDQAGSALQRCCISKDSESDKELLQWLIKLTLNIGTDHFKEIVKYPYDQSASNLSRFYNYFKANTSPRDPLPIPTDHLLFDEYLYSNEQRGIPIEEMFYWFMNGVIASNTLLIDHERGDIRIGTVQSHADVCAHAQVTQKNGEIKNLNPHPLALDHNAYIDYLLNLGQQYFPRHVYRTALVNKAIKGGHLVLGPLDNDHSYWNARIASTSTTQAELFDINQLNGIKLGLHTDGTVNKTRRLDRKPESSFPAYTLADVDPDDFLDYLNNNGMTTDDKTVVSLVWER